jgi:predicted Zn-dependent protease
LTRRLFVAVLGLVLCGVAHGYPIAEERRLGESFAIEAAAALPLVREPAVVDFVTRLGQRIVDRLDSPQPFEYRFGVVQDDSMNAFAVPGGFVYLNTGVLLRAGNESELAGVLAHEIGHSHAHHFVRQQEEGKLLGYAALAGALLSILHPAIGAVAAGIEATQQLKYQRQFEEEADYLAVRYVQAAGFDPHGLTSFMKRLWNEQRTSPLDQVPPYLLTHPVTDERISNLEAATKDVAVQPDSQRPTFALERVQAIARALGGRQKAPKHRQPTGGSGGRALALQGISLLYGGDAAGAAPALEEARAPGLEEIDDDLALARFRNGDLEGAQRAARRRLEEAPQDAVARALLGGVLVASKDYAGAIKELEPVSREAPELDQAQYDLGQAYGRNGSEALGFYHLARAFEMRGDVSGALAQYRKAAKGLPPDSEEAATTKQRVEVLQEVAHRSIVGR